MSIANVVVQAGQVSPAVQIDMDHLAAGVTVLALLTGYTSGSYKIQISNNGRVTEIEQLVGIPTAHPRYPKTWVDHEGLTGLTDSKSATLLYIGQWVRIDATALATGSINIGVSQADNGQRPYLDPYT